MTYPTAAVAKARNTSLADFSDQYVTDAISEFAGIVSRYCGLEFASATVTEQVTERPLRAAVVLHHQNISSVTATCDGVSVDMTYVVVNATEGTLDRVPWPAFWPTTATVTYTYGATCPADISRAAIEYAARTLNSEASGTSRDVRWQSPDGAVSFVQPDWDRGRPTGWTEVDRVLNSYRGPAGNFA